MADSTLKKKYRNIALLIHPGWSYFILFRILIITTKTIKIDKNPHPDAKAAFDSLQDAFDT